MDSYVVHFLYNVLKRNDVDDGELSVNTNSNKRKMNQTSTAALEDQHFYSFPPLSKLAAADEATLRVTHTHTHHITIYISHTHHIPFFILIMLS
jgi:hypothetical protein